MIHTLEFKAMGCRMLAAVEAGPERPALLDETPGWFAEWEQTLSRFRPDSELSHLNRSEGEPFQASAVLWNVYQTALHASRLSGGLVTPTLLEALEQAGYEHSFDEQPSFEPAMPGSIYAQPAARKGRGIRRKSEINSQGGTIRLPKGARLDFGGVGKGWSAHHAMRRLQRLGPALVDAGGDIAISEAGKHGPWPVGIEDPFNPGSDLSILQLGGGGAATSGRNYRRWQQDGRWMHHIIDPRTGQPAETDVLTATVIAPNVVQAEMAAKTAFILGSREGLAWLAERPNYAGLLVLEDGQRLCTFNFENYLEQQPDLLGG